MEPGHAPEKTLMTGIVGAEQFADSVRRWSDLAEQQEHAAKDDYHVQIDVAGCDSSDLLARVTRAHARRPLLAGRSEGDFSPLKRVLGYAERDVWNTYSGMPQGDGSATFSTIERCTTVLLFADYTMRPARVAGPGGKETAAGVAVDVHVKVYLSGWQRYASPLLLPRLRALVLHAVSAKVRD